MNEQKPPFTPDRVKSGERTPNFLLRFFLPRYMVPDSKKRGDDFGDIPQEIVQYYLSQQVAGNGQYL